eukprot:jgi/Mesvir1/13846/Mv15992-RA.1
MAELGITGTIGRVFLAAVFLLAAYNKFDDGEPIAKFTGAKFAKFINLLPFDIPFGLPEPKALVMTGMIMEGLGGLLLMSDIRLGAYLLLLYTSAASVIFHDFYNYVASSLEFQNELVLFFKNLAMLGGLLVYLDVTRPETRGEKLKRL